MKTYFTITLILFPLIIFGQDKPIGQIPFAINEDGNMTITLKINNSDVSNFILDTGSSVTAIDKTIAEQLNLALQEKGAKIIGTSGVNNDVKKTQKQHISLNNKIELKDIELYVTDLSRLGKINGLIGFDLFKEYVTKTNFDTKIISFYKRKGKPDTKGYTAINFSESFCTPEIKISLSLPNDESFSGKVLFDTGNASEPFSFNSPFVNNHKLTKKFKKLTTTDARGIDALYRKVENGVIPFIKIKKFKLSEIPIALSNAQQGMSSKEAYMGNLGLKYISKFNFILDYNKKKIYLKPNKSFDDAFNFPLSGIHLEEKEEGVFIRLISKPSMAYDKGLRAGQQLISIDGIKEKDKQFYQKALRSEDKVVSITVQLEDGTLKTVQILLKRLI
ncbi:aspartyl protease family protein [uncultured Aquimarina sp.]|uniref:aspartyl protease family protein n=1 Tax=uncultured Aquimarina sp. TaxID=575652 RepID=UPI0026210F42|nr:aspartyl protease family protein [uncultured Aquimarina sp.]